MSGLVPDSEIARAAHRNLHSFESILKEPEASGRVHDAVEDLFVRFRLWAGNIGAWHSKNDARSADHRLRDTPDISEWIVELLEELQSTADAICDIASGHRPNRRDEDEGTDSEGTDEASELCLMAGDIITSLMKVSMELKKATTRDRYVNAASAKQEPYLRQFDCQHVTEKFPKTRAKTWLHERLGAAITQRRQFLRYMRDHHSRISSMQSTDPTDAIRETAAPMASMGPFLAPSGPAQSSRPSQSPTAASTVQPELVIRQDVEALDKGDDAASDATSFISSRPANMDQGGLDVIPLEKLSQDRLPFECPYCFSFVQSNKMRTWRKHVFRDLRAYVCTFERCEVGLFESREAWFKHEMDVHRREWFCQSCPARVFESSKDFETHLRASHGNKFNHLTLEALNLVAQTSSRPVEQIPASACPMCDDWDGTLRQEAEEVGKPIPNQHLVLQSSRRFAQHLGGHQEQLALFAVPLDINEAAQSGSGEDQGEVEGRDLRRTMSIWQDALDDSFASDDLRINPSSLIDSEPDDGPGPAGQIAAATSPYGHLGGSNLASNSPTSNVQIPDEDSDSITKGNPPIGQGFQYEAAEVQAIGNDLLEYELDKLPAHLKKQGDGWRVVFNPSVPRTLDVDLVQTFHHDSVVCCVKFSLDGRYVATGSDRAARIYDVDTGELLRELLHDFRVYSESSAKQESEYVRSVCFSPDRSLLATGGEDKLLRIWNIPADQLQHCYSGHNDSIFSIDLNSECVISGSGDGNVRIWSLTQDECLLILDAGDSVSSVALSPHGRYIAASTLGMNELPPAEQSDSVVRLWDLRTGELLGNIGLEEGHPKSIHSIAFNFSGDCLLSGSLDSIIKMWAFDQTQWDLANTGRRNSECTRTFKGHRDYVLSVAFSQHDEWIISGSKDCSVQFWDPKTGLAHFNIWGHENSVISVASSPVSDLIATASGDFRVRIWRCMSLVDFQAQNDSVESASKLQGRVA